MDMNRHEPIDLSHFREGAPLGEALLPKLLAKLAELRGAHPQIPGDTKKLDAMANRILSAVSGELAKPEFTSESLARALRTLEFKGLGQANRLWPGLFSLSTDSSRPDGRLSVTSASRPDLARGLRALFGTYFAGRPGQLEWAVAAVLAWRPMSIAEIHCRVHRVIPSFMDLEAFRARFSAGIALDRAENGGFPALPTAPDWTRTWQNCSETAYGGGYPPGVAAFIGKFLSDQAARDPAARVLDIGTGNHSATLLARKASPQFEIFGIDVAEPQPVAESERIQVLKMSAEALDFPDRNFTTVMSVNGIEYAELDLALPEMRRVMDVGAEGALVLHRPDSAIAARSRMFMEFLEGTLLLETLALCWLFLDRESAILRRELHMQLEQLEAVSVHSEFTRYFNRVLEGIPRVMRARDGARQQAFGVVDQMESDLRWTFERDRFLLDRMVRIPADRDGVRAMLEGFGFVVTALEDLYFEAGREGLPVGWAVRLRKPGPGERVAPDASAASDKRGLPCS